MKKRIALAILGVILIAGGILGGLRLAVTAQAEGSQSEKADAAADDTWQTMHQACLNGDLEAMRGIMEGLGVDWNEMHDACSGGDMSGMLDAMKAAHGGDLDTMTDAMTGMHGEDAADNHCDGSQMDSTGGMHAGASATGVAIEGGRLSPMMGMH